MGTEACLTEGLWARLSAIPDRRGRKGRQHGLPAVLTLSLAAMLAGANDLRAIFRWGRRLPREALLLLGLERAPCHAMYHDFFKALDVAAAERVLSEWVRGSGPAGHVALDGKRLRGSAPGGHDGSPGVHLVAAFASRLGGVIGQLQVEPDGNEVGAALTLLKGLPLQGTVITGDAIFCQRAICQGIRDGRGDYLFAVEANQPDLMADIALAFGDAFPPRNCSRRSGSRRRRPMTSVLRPTSPPRARARRATDASRPAPSASAANAWRISPGPALPRCAASSASASAPASSAARSPMR